MRRHLQEREFIEYQFKLVPDARIEEIGEHLQRCSDCRERLEEQRRRFSALELLGDKVKVSEDLIARVTKQAAQPAPARTLSFKRHWWVGAAAAVLVAGLLFVLVNRIDEPVPGTKIIRGPGGLAKGAGMVTDGSAVEGAPFAPASAIELVTLPRRQNVQLTIYNSADLTLVRERRTLTLKKGWNWIQFMWANTLIDPTSLAIEPLAEAQGIDVEQLVFPARLRDVGRWLIRSDVSAAVPFEITYLTSGLSWRAFYMGTLGEDEKSMDLQGYVRVDNGSGEDYENAQTRLIVGKVHLLDEIAMLARRDYPHGRPQFPQSRIWFFSDYKKHRRDEVLDVNGVSETLYVGYSLFEIKGIAKEGLSEYFLYTIEGRETIPDKWGKRLLSFEAEDIPVRSLYKYDEERWGESTIRFGAFANDKEHNLGDTPIPNGSVKIYARAGAEGHLSYVGGTSVKYIPVDEKVELNLGPAREVIVRPVMMDFRTESLLFDDAGDLAGWDEVRTWKVEVNNARELPVDVEITRGFGTSYWRLETAGKGAAYEKHDVSHARFKLTVDPRNKRTFTYTVRTYHGLREESMSQ